MFVDIVSSEYDLDSLEVFAEVTSKWNHHDVRQLDKDFACSKVLEISQREKLHPLSQREIKPMMSSCSAGYKQNSDGSWEITAEVKFTNRDEKEEKESENSNESSAGQGTTSKDTDPPDSRDRDKD